MRLLLERRLFGFVAALALPGVALAHLGGVPTSAVPTNPLGVGEVVQGPYGFGWTDFDDRATTQETVIDWHFTADRPPTFLPGWIPEGPEGAVIVKGIPELDLANTFTWDTAAVPAGSYFLYSIAHDPPFDTYVFSRGVVTIAREGEPIGPAVILTNPDGSRDVADRSFLVEYEAFDPDGTATVTLEATTALDGSGLFPVAAELPATATGSFLWDTSCLPADSGGTWYLLRARISDARGLSFATWGSHFVRVDHGIGGGCGGAGGGGAGGSGGVGGGGSGGGTEAPEGCGCGSGGPVGLGLAVALASLLRRRQVASRLVAG